MSGTCSLTVSRFCAIVVANAYGWDPACVSGEPSRLVTDTTNPPSLNPNSLAPAGAANTNTQANTARPTSSPAAPWPEWRIVCFATRIIDGLLDSTRAHAIHAPPSSPVCSRSYAFASTLASLPSSSSPVSRAWAARPAAAGCPPRRTSRSAAPDRSPAPTSPAADTLPHHTVAASPPRNHHPPAHHKD